MLHFACFAPFFACAHSLFGVPNEKKKWWKSEFGRIHRKHTYTFYCHKYKRSQMELLRRIRSLERILCNRNDNRNKFCLASSSHALRAHLSLSLSLCLLMCASVCDGCHRSLFCQSLPTLDAVVVRLAPHFFKAHNFEIKKRNVKKGSHLVCLGWKHFLAAGPTLISSRFISHHVSLPTPTSTWTHSWRSVNWAHTYTSSDVRQFTWISEKRQEPFSGINDALYDQHGLIVVVVSE